MSNYYENTYKPLGSITASVTGTAAKAACATAPEPPVCESLGADYPKYEAAKTVARSGGVTVSGAVLLAMAGSRWFDLGPALLAYVPNGMLKGGKAIGLQAFANGIVGIHSGTGLATRYNHEGKRTAGLASADVDLTSLAGFAQAGTGTTKAPITSAPTGPKLWKGTVGSGAFTVRSLSPVGLWYSPEGSNSVLEVIGPRTVANAQSHPDDYNFRLQVAAKLAGSAHAEVPFNDATYQFDPAAPSTSLANYANFERTRGQSIASVTSLAKWSGIPLPASLQPRTAGVTAPPVQQQQPAATDIPASPAPAVPTKQGLPVGALIGLGVAVVAVGMTAMRK